MIIIGSERTEHNRISFKNTLLRKWLIFAESCFDSEHYYRKNMILVNKSIKNSMLIFVSSKSVKKIHRLVFK